MDYYTVKRLALVQAKIAEMEAMKAENDLRRIYNQAPSYGEVDFMKVSNDLENLANTHDERL